MLFGLGHDGHDEAALGQDKSAFEHTDKSGDAQAGQAQVPLHDAGLRIFTMRGLVAFFSVFGWCGLVCVQKNFDATVSLIIASVAGLVAMLSIALLLKVTLRLQSTGTVSLSNAVGKSATVYMRVPARRAERGKVNVLVQESYVEADAMTDEVADLSPGHEVTVIGMANPNTLLVAAKK
jgi:membrane protein implicated in regulation of membrane protease activity